MHGQSYRYRTQGSELNFRGLWVKGRINGIGEEEVKTFLRKECNPSNDGLFKGLFKDGKSLWQIEFQNGDQYKGDFNDLLPSGHGIMIYSNGDIYEGKFDHGLRHGAVYKVLMVKNTTVILQMI